MKTRKAAVAVAIAGVSCPFGFAQQGGTILDAFRDGKLNIDLRYRFESVEQANALRDADASTLRTRVGFFTDEERLLSLKVEAENVLSLGSENFNSTTNNRTDYSVVADPETTEVNQAFLRLQLNENRVTVGRQRMVLDNGRFLGNVGFRQNEQTYDAATWMNTQFDGHRFIYTYMDEAHRFFGDDSPAGNLDMSSHFLNYRYQWPGNNALVLYAYLLEMDARALAGRSTKSLGARFTGSVDVGTGRALYTLEYADQSPYADGNDTNDADYLLAELGAHLPSQWTLRLGYEKLSGDGTYAFQTPLATAHAFAGDADVFAGATPPAGLVDRYLKMRGPIGALDLRLAYHDFVSDSGGLDYGSEWDVVLIYTFGRRVSVGAQYADYSADQFAVDTSKLWLWARFRY